MTDVDPPASDIVDARLLEAMRGGGCPICVVRARSEKATMDAIINERVLDIGFRADLERKQAFCRRHVAELVPTDRRETGGILGSSMLLSAVIDRRLDLVRGGTRPGGSGIRVRLRLGRKRPPCVACSQADTAVGTAIVRFADRSSDPAWATALAGTAFCLDDFLLLWEAARSRRGFEPVARRQVERFDDLRRRLDGFAHHSSHDRLQLMTDEERTAADEATRLLGGDLH
ncbi:MAG: DUF6062 family protein [Chloroflexota bacterium]